MGIYEELGVPPVINAMGTFTIYGGSKMSPQTLRDMQEAAASFVDIRLLQRRLSQAVAELTHNEAAYICGGASCGVYLSLLAAIAKKRGKKVRHLSREDFYRSEVILFRSHRNPYDIVLDQLGVKLVELAYPNHSLKDPCGDILAAITPDTAAVYYLESGWVAPGAPALSDVIRAARTARIPVVLDAAAMLPPVENLWAYTAAGVDLAVFSGGKDLRGPQSSGLIVGSLVLIDILLEEGFPSHGYGRMFKVGREEMAGLYSALKQFLAADHEARKRDAEEQVALARNMLGGHPLYEPLRSYPNEAGQPIPRVHVRLKTGTVSSGQILAFLAAGSPPVIVADSGPDGFYLNPMTLTMAEMELICRRLLDFTEIPPGKEVYTDV